MKPDYIRCEASVLRCEICDKPITQNEYEEDDKPIFMICNKFRSSLSEWGKEHDIKSCYKGDIINKFKHTE